MKAPSKNKHGFAFQEAGLWYKELSVILGRLLLLLVLLQVFACSLVKSQSTDGGTLDQSSLWCGTNRNHTFSPLLFSL